MKRSVLYSTLLYGLYGTLLMVLNGTLSAQEGSATDAHRSSSSPVSSFDASTSALVTVYSNLGPMGRVYDRRAGWLVNGTRTQFPQWMGMPFPIKANATITQIKIAVLHYSGTNGFTLAITEDDHGLPGRVKHKWEIKKMPPVGTCCTLKVANVTSGIKVQKGETYWVVAETDSTNSDTSDQWEYTWNHSHSKHIAVKAHPFVWVLYHGGVSAFAVYGTRP